MPGYIGLPDFKHGDAGRLGVLLVNLGTPDNPRAPAVRRFLAEFLWDPRVVETPRWLWWLILRVILRIRPARSAHAYQQIWTPAGSPLLLHSRELADACSNCRAARPAAGIRHSHRTGDDLRLAVDFTGARAAARAGMRRLLVLPLYPQYSATTTASVFDRVTSDLRRFRWLPELRFINDYHDEPAYIDGVASSHRGALANP